MKTCLPGINDQKRFWIPGWKTVAAAKSDPRAQKQKLGRRLKRFIRKLSRPIRLSPKPLEFEARALFVACNRVAGLRRGNWGAKERGAWEVDGHGSAAARSPYEGLWQ